MNVCVVTSWGNSQVWSQSHWKCDHNCFNKNHQFSVSVPHRAGNTAKRGRLDPILSSYIVKPPKTVFSKSQFKPMYSKYIYSHWLTKIRKNETEKKIVWTCIRKKPISIQEGNTGKGSNFTVFKWINTLDNRQ